MLKRLHEILDLINTFVSILKTVIADRTGIFTITDTADISVLKLKHCYYHCAKSNMLKLMCY